MEINVNAGRRRRELPVTIFYIVSDKFVDSGPL
jgi:hypothetical protein